MINFFRGIRKTLFSESKFTKYLIYAIGEIILVVIGILIALSINNWNEGKKEAERLSSIYQTIKGNLETDTANVAQVIAYHEKIDSLIDRQLSGELTDELIATIDSSNYQSCIVCQPLNSTYETFFPQQKGYSLLQNFADNHESSSNELSSRIIQFYSEFLPVIEGDITRIEDMIIDNVKDFEKQEWYVDVIYGKFNPKLLDYVKNDLTYKNSTVSYKMMSTGNYLRNLKEYQKEGSLLLEEIELHLSNR